MTRRDAVLRPRGSLAKGCQSTRASTGNRRRRFVKRIRMLAGMEIRRLY
jgi:hypothetical protein